MSDSGVQIAPMQASHIKGVAEIHAQALAGDFLPSLGLNFLKVFYTAALASGAALGCVALSGDTPIGFVLGSPDMSILFRKVIRGAPLQLAREAIPAILRRPALLLKVAETFLYPSREPSMDVEAELAVIAVKPEFRNQGLGLALIEALNAEFKERKIWAYKVTVLQSNQGANRFYARFGFQRAGEFRLYHQSWNLYVYSLPEAIP
jgi:ribosomal protein S18 acetylase RimI-like enzyme